MGRYAHTSGDIVRQVPCHPPSGRGLGCGSQERVCQAPGSRAALYQGPEVHVAVAQGEPLARRQEGVEYVVGANRRLNTAYVLKESFGQLWSYEREGWARRFFENWRASLKWQRLKPYEKFAKLIDRHWDGVAAYCRLENKVSLGFVEGLNNKIRVIQRRAYGLRNEDYLRLKILTCMLPAL